MTGSVEPEFLEAVTRRSRELRSEPERPSLEA